MKKMRVRKYLQRRKQRINLLQMHYPLSNTNLSLKFLLKFRGLQTQYSPWILTLTSPSWCKPGLAARVRNRRPVGDAEDPCRRLLSWPVSGMIGKYQHCSGRRSESCQPTVQSLGLKWCPPSADRAHRGTESWISKVLPLPRLLGWHQSGIPGQGFFWGQVWFRAAWQCKRRRFIFKINTLPQHFYIFQESTCSVPPWIKCFGLEKVIAIF